MHNPAIVDQTRILRLPPRLLPTAVPLVRAFRVLARVSPVSLDCPRPCPAREVSALPTACAARLVWVAVCWETFCATSEAAFNAEDTCEGGGGGGTACLTTGVMM